MDPLHSGGSPNDCVVFKCMLYLSWAFKHTWRNSILDWVGGTGGTFEDINLVSKLRSINRLPSAR